MTALAYLLIAFGFAAVAYRTAQRYWPARPLRRAECDRLMRDMGMAGCEHPDEHLL